MKTACLLSVDWDYFFPDYEAYNFFATERYRKGEDIRAWTEVPWVSRSGLIRPGGNRPMFTVHRPVIPFLFWERFTFSRKAKLYVAESHKDIIPIMLDLADKVDVLNVDAHHDIIYRRGQKDDCGNWVHAAHRRGILSSYSLVYPSWRKKTPEFNVVQESSKNLLVNTKGPPVALRRFMPSYALPDASMTFDAVFLCRSGAWTPSWSDDKFFELIEQCSLPKVYVDPYAESKRPSPRREDAEDLLFRQP